MKKLPKAKTENIVVQDLKDELLVYNLTTHQAFTLNETLKIVYSACDGQMSFDKLKRQHKFTDDLIYLALDELKANNLLENYQSDHFGHLSRREVIKRVGLASMITLPVIVGLTAPTAASAASGGLANGVACTGNSDCRSNRCISTRFVTGSVFFVPGGNRCCVQGGGDYLNVYFAPPGNCNFAANCCTGTGTETAPSSCECALTS